MELPIRIVTRLSSVVAVVAITAATAAGYIHFPPMTLAKMCKDSHHIRVLTVEKFDKEKRIVVFSCAETLKDGKSMITSYKVFVRPEATGSQPVLNWLKEGKRAVMFSIEGKDREAKRAIAYVFIDDYCFSTDHNPEGMFWLLIRGEPDLSACYHGSAEWLREAVKDTLAGKEVKVPVTGPNAKVDRDKRKGEVNDAFRKNRSQTPISLIKAATTRPWPGENYPVLPAISTEMRGLISNEIAGSAAIRKAYEKLDATGSNVDWFQGVKELEQHKAVWSLLSCLCHPHDDVQIHALKSLQKLGDKRAVPFLLLYADHMAVGESQGARTPRSTASSTSPRQRSSPRSPVFQSCSKARIRRASRKDSGNGGDGWWTRIWTGRELAGLRSLASPPARKGESR